MNERSVFASALGIPDPADRAAYLDRACGSDAALRRQVEALLAAHARSGSFMPAPAGGEGTGTYERPLSEGEGTVVGPYTLREQIGEGGMGLVFVAEQQHPVRRKVALKVIKPGMDSRQVVARFEAERQALALMDHPNIARVLDAGTTETGRPYFVMELVRGVPITDYCDANHLTPKDRLALFVQVCNAVQHAHQKGVIHRDLKPSNILVAPHDGVPVVKVIDFGVAKALGQSLTEKTIYTRFAQMIGTPLYMSPEQAEVNQLDVDTRSDVYSLGVLLYELLTGTTPFDGDRFRKAAFDEIRRIIREEEPPRPSTRLTSLGATLTAVSSRRGTDPKRLAGLVRGELDWIVMRCLEKDRTRRYGTATDLAKDVQRFLADEPVEACPPTLGYRLRKAIRRHKPQVVVASLLVLALLAGIIGTSWGLLQAKRAEEVARDEEQKALVDRDEKGKALVAAETARAAEAQTNNALQASLAAEKLAAYDMTIPLVQKAFQDHDPLRAAALLGACPAEFRGWEWDFLSRLLDRDGVVLRPAYSGYTRPIYVTYRFTPDAKAVVGVSASLFGRGRFVQVWDTDTGALASQWEITGDDLTKYGGAAVLSPDAKWLAVWGSRQVPQVVSVFDTRTGKVARRLPGHTGPVHVLFSDDGRRIATASGGTIRVWADAEEPVAALDAGATGTVFPLAFLPDGTGLVSIGRDDNPGEFAKGIDPPRATEELVVWDLGTRMPRVRGSVETDDPTRPDGNTRMVVSPDGRYALLTDDVRRNVLFDLTAGKQALETPKTTEFVGFAAGGKSVLGYTTGFTLNEIDIATGRTVKSHRLPAPATARTWPIVSTTLPKEKKGPRRRKNWAVSLSRDGTRLAVATMQMGNRMTVVEVASGTEVRSIPLAAQLAGEFFQVELSADGGRLLTAGNNGLVKVWDLREPSLARPFTADEAKQAVPPEPLAVSPDGRYLALMTRGTQTDEDGKKAPSTQIRHADARTGRTNFPPFDVPPEHRVSRAEYSPDGQRFAVLVSSSRIVRDTGFRFTLYIPLLADVSLGQVVFRGKPVQLVREDIERRSLKVPQIGFAPDGTFLLATYAFSNDGRPFAGHWEVRDVAADRLVFSTEVGEEHGFEFVPGGRRAFVAGRAGGGFMEVWDMASGNRVWRKSAAADESGAFELSSFAQFSPDGRRMITFDTPAVTPGPARRKEAMTDPSRRATVWEVETGREVSSLTLASQARLKNVAFTPDGRRVLVQDGGNVRKFALLYDADTGREVLSLNDLEPNSFVEAGVFLPDGRLVCRAWGPKLATDTGAPRVWDGRPTAAKWAPARSVDDLLSDAYRLCDDPDPARRDPASAVALTARAVAAYPDEGDCWGAHGMALVSVGKDGDALAALTRQKDRTGGYPPLLLAQRDYLLAVAHHRLGNKAAALAAFDAAERAIREPVRLPNIELSLGGRSAPFPDPGERPRAERYRAFAVATLGIDPEPLPPVKVEPQKSLDLREGPSDRLYRAAEVAKRGDHAAAAKATDEVLAGDHIDPGVLYNAACTYSLAAGVVKGDPGLRTRYADRAMELLKRCVAEGLVEYAAQLPHVWAVDPPAHMKKDTDLDPIRDRADFKKLLSELEAKYPPRAVAPPPREVKR